MVEGKRRPWRGENSRAQWVNALMAPLNLALMIGILLVGVVAGAPLALSVALAAVVYAAAVGRSVLEADKAAPGVDRGRTPPGDRPPMRMVAGDELAPEIRAQVDAVGRRESRIRRAVEAADNPHKEARDELDALVAETQRSARAAQMLRDGLAGVPVAELKDRLSAAQRDSSRGESAGALRERLEVAQRIEAQLTGYHGEIERLCGRLDALGDDLLANSITTLDERRLAAEVRVLRQEMGALADGVETASQEVPTRPAERYVAPRDGV